LQTHKLGLNRVDEHDIPPLAVARATSIPSALWHYKSDSVIPLRLRPWGPGHLRK
jgi:hypothetical protein